MTVILTVISITIALVLGVIFGLFRVSRSIVLRGIGTTFVDIFRGTPTAGAGILHLLRHPPLGTGFQMSALTAGIITLSLNAGAYMTEIVRGGIQSVDKGQMEAARSLGIGYLPTMRKVILPQAIRTMIPSYINQFVITLKDTSILSVIGIAELTQTGRIIIAGNFQSFKMWLIIGIIYFIVIMALTKLSDRVEKKDREMTDLVPDSADAAPAGTVMIHIDGLKKSFGELVVLDGITTDIKQGEVVCVIGRPGREKNRPSCDA